MTMHILDLPPEALEPVFHWLFNWKDLIALGSSCVKLQEIFTNPTVWGKLLETKRKANTEDNSLEEVDKLRYEMIIEFLAKYIGKPEPLLAIMVNTICKQHQNRGREGGEEFREDEDDNVITVRSPSHPWLHHVSGLGLKLLVLTEGQENRHKLHRVYLGLASNSSLLLSLGTVALRQEEQISQLVASGEISCESEELGRALFSLLEKSVTWSLFSLLLAGDLGERFWEELGRVAARPGGRVQFVYTRRIRAVREDLLAVLGITQRFMFLKKKKNEDDEDSWKRILPIHVETD